MKIRELLQAAERLTRDNSSSILTAFGVTGVVSTAYLTGKATFKAAHVLAEKPPTDKKETVQVVWKFYIPPAISATMTIGCILGAAKINSRRTAALTAAYSLSEKAFVEYKEKVIETLGEKKEKKVRDEIAAERVAQNPPSSTILLANSGSVLCCELWTGRYFESDMETLRKAQNEVNAKLLREDEATLADFYYAVGIPNTTSAAYSGWKTPRTMELDFTTVLHDNKPCLAFEYNYVTSF